MQQQIATAEAALTAQVALAESLGAMLTLVAPTMTPTPEPTPLMTPTPPATSTDVVDGPTPTPSVLLPTPTRVEIVQAEHRKAYKLLADNKRKLDEIAQYLYEKETISGEEFMRILNAQPQLPAGTSADSTNAVQ